MFSPIFYLRLTFLASVALLLLLTWQSYDRIKDLIISSGKADQTQQVISKVEQIMSLTKDAETGQRGYLLTHRDEFLEPYKKATRELGRNIQQLDDLTRSGKAYRPLIDSLRIMSEKRMTWLNMVILNDTLPRRSVSLNRIDMLVQGKDMMDKMRSLADRILEQEQAQLLVYNQEKMESERITPKYVVVVSSLAIFLLVISFLIANRELRQRLIGQQDLEQKIDALNRSNAELEQFAYVASHDLQEPLRKIRAFGDRLQLKHRDSLNEDGHSLLNKIEVSAARMQVLIDDLLNFSRLVNQKGELAETDLNRVLAEVITDLGETIKDKKADVRVLSPLPVLDAYPTQMRQLFQNLVSNGLKFSKDHGRPHVHISYDITRGTDLRTEIPNCRLVDHHHITVRDNGIGFDPQYAQKIFVIFQRLHGRGEFSGTGIGLAVCQRVIANHQGYIKATSTPGDGAEFHIYIPVSLQKVPA